MDSGYDYADEKREFLVNGNKLMFPSVTYPPNLKTTYVATEFLQFTSYPENDMDLNRNVFLWKLVRSTAFSETEVREHFEQFAPLSSMSFIVVPPKLKKFLLGVSLEEMETTIAYMLADTAQGEDEPGLSEMAVKIQPRIWGKVQHYLGIMNQEGPASGPVIQVPKRLSAKSRMLDNALQAEGSESLWSIPLEIGFLEPISVQSQVIPFCGIGHGTLSVSCGDLSDVMELDLGSQDLFDVHVEHRIAVLDSMYRDWCMYLEAFSGRYSAYEAQLKANEIMVPLWVARSERIRNEIKAVKDCSKSLMSYLSRLHTALLDHGVIPSVIDRASQAAERILQTEEMFMDMETDPDLESDGELSDDEDFDGFYQDNEDDDAYDDAASDESDDDELMAD